MKNVILFALLVAVAATAASAQTQVNWPVSDHGYYCSWSKPDPNNPGSRIQGTAIVTFKNLAGNNYLRRGTLRNDYPPYDGSNYTETPVTVTKPVLFTDYQTQFELTTGTGVQCKDFETYRSGSVVFALYFDDCSNGAQQSCSW
jgi:hypothetical protein